MGAGHSFLIQPLQSKPNVYPTRAFLARGRQEAQIKSCQHRQAKNKTCSHVIGYCSSVQDTRIKKHNQLCELLVNDAKEIDWMVFQEPLLKDGKNELYKPDLLFVNRNQALVADIIVRYNSKSTSLTDAAAEKVRKYQHLKDQAQELTNATSIKLLGFLLGARGK